MFEEPHILEEQLSNIKNLPDTSKNLSNNTNNIQHINLNQSILSNDILKPVGNSSSLMLSAEEPKIVPIKNIEPSSSHYTSNKLTLTSMEVKTEPTIANNIFSQGTYRNEEDSVIVIYSSDEENDINENNFELPNIEIKEEQNNLNTISTINYPSTSNGEISLNIPEWSIQYQKDEVIISDDDDDVIYVPSNLNSNNSNFNAVLDSDDNDSDYNSKCPQIIEPLPMKPNKMIKQTTLLSENENIIKTRAKSEKILINKKKAEEMTKDQNKKIIQERRMRLQQLAKNNCISSSTERKSSTNDDYIDQPSTSEKLHKKNRISKLQQNNDCVPSTSKSHIASSTVNQNTQRISLKSDNSLYTNINRQLIFAYFDTLSIICKWNAAWLRVS